MVTHRRLVSPNTGATPTLFVCRWATGMRCCKDARRAASSRQCCCTKTLMFEQAPRGGGNSL